MTLRTLNYGNYGIFLIMGNAGFCPSAVQGRWSQIGICHGSMPLHGRFDVKLSAEARGGMAMKAARLHNIIPTNNAAIALSEKL